MEEVDSELLELGVVQEGIYFSQLQQGDLHLLSGLPGLEDQVTLCEDVVLEEKRCVVITHSIQGKTPRELALVSQ